jgi:hypothetical protein
MATATTRTTPTTEIPELAQKIREQVVSTIAQGQQFSIDAAQTWVKAVSALPLPEMPTVPGVPAVPGVEAVTKFSFDVASDLLNTQRDYALRLANVFVPVKSV